MSMVPTSNLDCSTVIEPRKIDFGPVEIFGELSPE